MATRGSFLFAVLRKVFRRFLKRKLEDPFERFFGLGHMLCSRCRAVDERQIHILIDGLITNQIALFAPYSWASGVGKMFGIDCRRFLFSPPPPPSCSPPPHFSPIFLICSPQACSLARPLFRSLVRSPPGKGKESAATQARCPVINNRLY